VRFLQENIDVDVCGKLSRLLVKVSSHVTDAELHKAIDNACLSSGNCCLAVDINGLIIEYTFCFMESSVLIFSVSELCLN